MTETERVTMIWPKELKAAAREKAGDRNLTEFTIEAVQIHLGISQDVDAATKELNEVKYFAQQLADQLVLGVVSPEERLQTMMELEFPAWIDTSGWPETYASRVRPVIDMSPGAFMEVGPVHVVTEEGQLVEEVEELIEQAESPRTKAILEAAVEEGFKPKDAGPRDDLFAKVMAKTGGKLDDVPGLKLASDLPKPAEKPVERVEPRKIEVGDIEVEF